MDASLPVLKSLLVTMFPSCEFSKWLRRRKGALFCTCVTGAFPLFTTPPKLVPCSSSRCPSPWRLYTLHSSTYRALFPSLPSDFSTNTSLPGSLFWPSDHWSPPCWVSWFNYCSPRTRCFSFKTLIQVSKCISISGDQMNTYLPIDGKLQKGRDLVFSKNFWLNKSLYHLIESVKQCIELWPDNS